MLIVISESDKIQIAAAALNYTSLKQRVIIGVPAVGALTAGNFDVFLLAVETWVSLYNLALNRAERGPLIVGVENSNRFYTHS